MLRKAVDYFVAEKHMMSCLLIACGDANVVYTACGGQIHANGTGDITPSTLFDLASLTKLFTGLTVMRLYEQGLLELDAPVTHYAPQFVHLSEITVDQVLGFEVALLTPERVDTQPTRAAGLTQLHALTPSAQGTGRFYSDMHAMVLGEVIEGASGLPLMDCLSRELLHPLGMADTFAAVPQARLANCVCYDREHRLEKGRYILREGIAPGTPHDPKARLLSPHGEFLCGHAGVFATADDMVRLCQGVLGGRVLTRDSLRKMARNRLGCRLPDGRYTQYLGSQCYVKHPQQYFSEIPLYMSDQAIGLSGFTGNHVAIDPEVGVFSLMLGNRVLNRLTVLVPEEGRTLTDYGLAPDGSGQFLWPDGTQVYSSVDYVHQKDAHVHQAIARTLGLSTWRKAGSEWP